MRPAFTLIELVVVILVVSIISAIALPALAERSQSAKRSALTRQMLLIEKACRLYRSTEGSWPRNTAHGIVPPEVRAYLKDVDFRSTPYDGAFDWNGIGTSLSHYGISMRFEDRRSIPYKDLIEIDEQLDDGDLKSGYVRLLKRQFFQFCLEEK